MSAAVFDTLKASRKLQAAGFAETQADAMVSTVTEAFGDTVATKADIARLEGDIKLLKWMIGVVLVCVAFPILKPFFG